MMISKSLFIKLLVVLGFGPLCCCGCCLFLQHAAQDSTLLATGGVLCAATAGKLLDPRLFAVLGLKLTQC